MASQEPSRRTIVIAAGAVLIAPPVALAQAGPADRVLGVYRGEVTAGPDAHTSVVVTVTKVAPDRIKLLSNRPAVKEAELKVVESGGKVTQAEGSVLVKFDLSAKPPTLEYRPGGDVVFVGAKL